MYISNKPTQVLKCIDKARFWLGFVFKYTRQGCESDHPKLSKLG